MVWESSESLSYRRVMSDGDLEGLLRGGFIRTLSDKGSFLSDDEPSEACALRYK